MNSEDNAYLRDIAGENYTAKDFRTWADTVRAAIPLRQFDGVARGALAKKNIVTAVDAPDFSPFFGQHRPRMDMDG